ncbi:MAG: hypothetical protein HY558_01405 [Euryarchaeota archaeon]|nr:hypothetical protein [Euryarchaeota archaeon]
MESLDYDIVAHLARHGPSSPKVMAHHLGVSGAYLRRRLGHLTALRRIRRVGRGLYEVPLPDRGLGTPRGLRAEKWRANLELRSVSPEERLRAGIEMSTFGSRIRGRRAAGGR